MARFETGHFSMMQNLAPPLISVLDLKKSYANTSLVLDGVTVSVSKGEKVALIGSNGAGKSTLLKCLVGLQTNSGGEITIFDETFGETPNRVQLKKIRRNIGFVFQAHGLVKRLSVLSNVIHGLLGQGGSWRGFVQATAKADWRQRALEALAMVNLEDKALARVDQLSGGQAQRVAIARALIRQPQLMIADEPAASLDPAAGHEVMRQFADLTSEKGITLVFTSHDMDHALKYADRVVALKAGKVMIDQPASELTENDLKGVFGDEFKG